ncbi:Hypothetical_protein [Hexamita inflata]|uniref:Hypothetical_protein n=1 Tax=Hexamita inflata TaxID=28002 RepID=A0AA86QKG6_9EUKA|nr:Hypothetical protein HINF_LOCUS45777 [Hexamita inflata]
MNMRRPKNEVTATVCQYMISAANHCSATTRSWICQQTLNIGEYIMYFINVKIIHDLKNTITPIYPVYQQIKLNCINYTTDQQIFEIIGVKAYCINSYCGLLISTYQQLLVRYDDCTDAIDSLSVFFLCLFYLFNIVE